jgi:hypothetical protein
MGAIDSSYEVPCTFGGKEGKMRMNLLDISCMLNKILLILWYLIAGDEESFLKSETG